MIYHAFVYFSPQSPLSSPTSHLNKQTHEAIVNEIHIQSTAEIRDTLPGQQSPDRSEWANLLIFPSSLQPTK